MCTADHHDFCPGAAAGTPTTAAVPPTALEDGAEPEPIWVRRTFLKAAALGTAAAALVGKGSGGLQLGPLPAYAHNPRDVNCRANDVRIIGTGQIVNEPCSCTGTFNARVRFEINNNTGTDRYCVTLHLCAGRTANGTTIPARDIIIGTVRPGTDFYEATIPNFPCNAGKVCFGPEITDGRTSCPAGEACCTIVSWDTVPHAQCVENDRITPSKCRLQQVCVQGFGAALECADQGCVSTGDARCSVGCGQTLYLKATATGASAGATAGTYTFTLRDPDGTVVATRTNVASPQCFAVTNPEDGKYGITVTDSAGCTRTAESAAVTVGNITATLTGTAPAACGLGKVAFEASTTGTGSCTYQFLVDNQERQAASATRTFTYDPVALGKVDDTCHTVKVVVRCGTCTADDATTVRTCATSSLGCTVALGTAAKAPKRTTNRRQRRGGR